RIETGTAPDRTKHEAVLGGDVVEPIGEQQAAGAIHVLRGDDRIARDVLAEMTGDQACVDIVTAADAVADHQVDSLARVDVRLRLRMLRRERDNKRRECKETGRQGKTHQQDLLWSRLQPSLALALYRAPCTRGNAT